MIEEELHRIHAVAAAIKSRDKLLKHYNLQAQIVKKSVEQEKAFKSLTQEIDKTNKNLETELQHYDVKINTNIKSIMKLYSKILEDKAFEYKQNIASAEIDISHQTAKAVDLSDND